MYAIRSYYDGICFQVPIIVVFDLFLQPVVAVTAIKSNEIIKYVSAFFMLPVYYVIIHTKQMYKLIVLNKIVYYKPALLIIEVEENPFTKSIVTTLPPLAVTIS